ncbi:DUF2281 domain-containing protein [Comamonas sp. NLF-1-9]|uniref:DUF2281 domain-containing protein n=1 Tax=Comamonas sp. NLF-1-9 TaxID=2853163 RepID=UPI001C497A1A|nr:DUF2281 domain-containing protein [Comamonas sp. NLF-1-9]QXL85452.1 DUF2281 domain-containing protein [Comamonas sp. NLF-1-9]
MNIAARIYNKVLTLPQQAASEVLQFAEFLASRHAQSETQAAVRQEASRFYERYKADLSRYRFDRDEANAR